MGACAPCPACTLWHEGLLLSRLCALLHTPCLRLRSDGCYISKGYDATTHFETTVDDVLDMYRRITGRDLDLTAKDPTAVENA